MLLKAFDIDLTQEDKHLQMLDEKQKGCGGTQDKIYYIVNTPAQKWRSTERSQEEPRDWSERGFWRQGESPLLRGASNSDRLSGA
jgi:hypothetical protein